MDGDQLVSALETGRVDSSYTIKGGLSHGTTLISQATHAPCLQLLPPFTSKEGILKEEPLIPGIYQRDKKVVRIDKSDPSSVQTYMKDDLDVSRLNEIHKHLWLAGLPQVSRALHNQVRVGRQVHITERADLHLVWRDNILYLKPLPDYLLNHSSWTNIFCTNRQLYESAKGFLYSYTWLICSKSDLRLAHEHGLISEDVKWEQWAPFSAAVVSNISPDLSDVNPRYIYGELRLTRLNLICRFCSQTFSFGTIIRGYEYGYRQYSTYLERNFRWVLTAFIYITVVLSAMQVGLGTSELVDDGAFNRASYIFSMFSILAPVISLFVGALFIVILVLVNVRYALAQRAASRRKYAGAFANEAVRGHAY
ncbi:hypothetical protein M440DRAFT_22671 [Trichoderma longibrachiatum ATCC 18648]|uniref:Uncharacterized protein n=1 Tax=Trichoderma longibrachiatum ATCC 18648 TaxID=983965 RepID=A0A2T4BRY1_TRILO|nr:hypothetical protein M440DRAFT_22671 [Trichoderma longibrachiatum ATCC 18648]